MLRLQVETQQGPGGHGKDWALGMSWGATEGSEQSCICKDSLGLLCWGQTDRGSRTEAEK